MKEIIFYRLRSGKSPIEEFLDTLSSKEAQEVVWVLQLIEEADTVSTKFYKYLSSSDGILDLATLFRTLNQTSYAAVSTGSIFSLLSAPFILFS